MNWSTQNKSHMSVLHNESVSYSIVWNF